VEKFVIGKEIEILMDIKPRSVDGVLMSVQTPKKNFLLLEMKNGTISFSVDTGKGPISASFTPASPYFLCDGIWHKIKGELRIKRYYNYQIFQIYNLHIYNILICIVYPMKP